MSRKNIMAEIKTINDKYERAKNDWGDTLLKNIKNKLNAKGYRSDLKLVCSNESVNDFEVAVKYDSLLGYPTEKDLLGLVGSSYPTHEINWELVSVDDSNNVVTMMLSPAKEIIPVDSVNAIPEEFVSIGTCLYKRAADSDGNIFEIWKLTQADDGSTALVRNKNDFEVLSNDVTKFKKGDVVNTPYGPGLFQRYDEIGNGFVQVGNNTHLVAKDALKPYDQDKEKTKIKDFYTQIYGPEFAEELVEDYTSKK